MPAKKWSKDRVIEAIRERQNLLTTTTWKDNARLYSAAVREFGSWHKALAAAGVEPTPPQWTKQRVIDQIRERYRNGLPLIGISKTERPLYAAAYRRFGSWRQALATAGVAAKVDHKWTHETVIAAIQDHHQQGLSMSKVWREDKRLYVAARTLFGTWDKAVSASGIPREPTRRWSKQRVVEAIRTRHQQGLAMSNVFRLEAGLYTAACRRFGSWCNALEAAGLKSKPVRRWSKDRVTKELQAMHRLPITNIRKVDMGLVGAVERYFGSLDNARRAAGLERPPRMWSRTRVLEAIQDRYVRGVSIEHADWKGDRSLACAAKKYFGDWYNALVAAGLGHLGTPQRRWTKEEVCRAIQDRYDRRLPIHGLRNQDGSLFYAAEKHFGGWRQALLAAGFQPKAHRST